MGWGAVQKSSKVLARSSVSTISTSRGPWRNQDVSLVVGKRITEELYIGYDVNMFSQLGQFRVRYDLGRGFRVETRSSAEATG
jgi:predicted SPOUT superfamily RNA methylase MTH1